MVFVMPSPSTNFPESPWLWAIFVLAGCGQAVELPCPEPDPPCAPRGPDEWASDWASDGPSLIPERLHVDEAAGVVEATFLAVFARQHSLRITYRVDIEDRTVMIFGIEQVSEDWAHDRINAMRSDGSLDALLVCEPLRNGGDVRLLPSRRVAPPRPSLVPETFPITSAIVIDGFAYDVWVGDPSVFPYTGDCARVAVRDQETGELFLRDHWGCSEGERCFWEIGRSRRWGETAGVPICRERR